MLRYVPSPLLLGLVLSILGFGCGGPAHSQEFLIKKHADWRYHADPELPSENWNSIEFDDEDWRSGQSGFGYGDGDDRTELTNMSGRFRSVYIRKSFQIDDPAEFRSLYLYLNFDDGFVAYLNGHQVASDSVSVDQGIIRSSHHEANGFQCFPIADSASKLRTGTNVLAIEGHNVSLQSSDFSLDPCLTTERVDAIDTLINPDDLLEDFAVFVDRLQEDSSYRTLRGIDLEVELAKVQRACKTGDLREFAKALHQFVAQIGDCHGGVDAGNLWPRSRLLPFRPADTKDGLAALKVDTDAPVNQDCPYIESINGVALDVWMNAASQYVAQGAPQFIRHRALRWMGRFDIVSAEMGADADPSSATVTLGLRSRDGQQRTEKRLRLSNSGYSLARVAQKPTRTLPENIGYLRIPSMDRRLTAGIVRDLRGLLDTDGLIIDVRDNGGGHQSTLQAIYGFFLPADSPPVVVNVAAYRLSPRFKGNHIAYRPTYRMSWNGWTADDRNEIQSVAEDFRPEWKLPPRQFSDWHYMLVRRNEEQQADAPYDKPVVVLCNEGSFSATDNFLNAFEKLPQVTLVGTPSGGGSGARREFTLPNTRFRVSLSSMASFRTDGKTFDGNGISVDREIKPILDDYLDPEHDSVLKEAVGMILEKRL